MSKKTEEIVKKILDDKLNSINEKIGGIFVYGFISGVIMCYSGFLSYFCGIGTGIIIANKYSFVSNQISEKVTYIFDNMVKHIQK
jgi:hypothetical protein